MTGTPAPSGTPVAGASQVLNVSNVEMVANNCKALANSGSGESHPTAAVVLAGISVAAIGATVGILATRDDGTEPVQISPSR